MLLDWISFLLSPNLFGIKDFVDVIVIHTQINKQKPKKVKTAILGNTYKA
jgi:hypothetical protein